MALDAMDPPREVAGQYRVMVVKRPFGMRVQKH